MSDVRQSTVGDGNLAVAWLEGLSPHLGEFLVRALDCEGGGDFCVVVSS
jgi:hypothetical protein